MRSSKLICTLIVFTLACKHLYAQLPQINTIDKSFANPSQVVTISGSNFGTDPTKLAVYFGGAKGTITTATDQLLEVQTPFGTTFDKINVINTTSGLSGSSRESFFLDFGGSHPFSASNLKPQVDLASGSGLYDHCLCDFDGDAKLDVATANSGSNSISFYKNGSTVGSFSFTTSSASVGIGTVHARCGDLNGDGLPDLVISEANGGTRIFVFKNLGSFSFSSPATITLTGKKVKRIEIADLDGDGKSELIVTDQGTPSSGVADIIILPNQSSTSSISFGAAIAVPIKVTATAFTTTDGIAVEDINGDSRPEIIVSQFLSGGGIAVLHNESTSGNFVFTDQVELSASGPLVNIKIGDLDGDRLPEIVVTQILLNQVSVFLNKSGTGIQFASPSAFATDINPWGLDFGDLDGDGKLDMVIASIKNKSLTVLNNNSTTGSLSFTQSIIPTTYINRHVKIADMDGDAKPDITFTSVDDTSVPASKVSIIRNAACMIPVVSPGGPLTICTGFPLKLIGTINGGTSYQWYNNNVVMAGETNPYLNVTITGQYSVTAIAESGSCSQSSNAVNVTVSAGAALGSATISGGGPICFNSTLQLSSNNVGATQYSWRGPNNYTGTGLLPVGVTNFSNANAGRYYLDVYSGTCLAQETSTLVEAVEFPKFRISTPSAGAVCQGQTEVLSLTPTVSNVSYQWYEKTSGILNTETNSTLNVSTAGSYYSKVTSTSYSCAPAYSDTVAVKVVSLPVVDFSSPTNPCVGQLITFTNLSTTDPQATAVYNWNFGDGNNSTDQNPTHSYSVANASTTVQLTVSYTGGICSQSKSTSLNVQAAPALTIISNTGLFSFCEGTTLTLQASGSGFDANSYSWNTSATSTSIVITTGGDYSVSAKATTSGCVITAQQTITLLPMPTMTISAVPPLVDEGKPAQLTATGLMSYTWHPGKTLSDSIISNPVATPLVTTLYVVTGPGINGCNGKDSIVLNVKGESITGKLKPANMISPGNGDTFNEKWEIENILTYPQCGVTIYDDKGIKVYEAKPYNNDWDGTFNGRLLPIGAYYYIIKCDGDGTPKTGSITIVR